MLLLYILQLLLVHGVAHPSQHGDVKVGRAVRHALQQKGALSLQIVGLSTERLVLTVPLKGERSSSGGDGTDGWKVCCNTFDNSQTLTENLRNI